MNFKNYLLAEYEELERDYAYYLEQYGYDEEMSYQLESIRRKLDQLKTRRLQNVEQTGKSLTTDYIS